MSIGRESAVRSWHACSAEDVVRRLGSDAALGLDAAGLQRLFYDEAGLYLEESSKYDPEGEGLMRLNIGCPRSVLETALERMWLVIGNSSNVP